MKAAEKPELFAETEIKRQRRQIAVLLVSNSLLTRLGLNSLLKEETSINLLGEVTTPSEAVSFLQTTSVNVVLLDAPRPDGNVLSMARELLDSKPQPNLLILTGMENTTTLARLIMAGVRGYLIYRRLTPQKLIEALHQVSRGKNCTENYPKTIGLPDITTDHVQSKPRRAEYELTPLTPREQQIFNLISEGKRNREIARALSIGEKTVKNHINNIYTKLNIKNRYQAIRLKLSENSSPA